MPASLTLEVTESTLMRDARTTVARLKELKEIGVIIAIDDFGTGYSSMAYLRQFPVDILKIDRSFVADMNGSPDAHALIHTLVELGRTLGLVTLAEGIEVASQLEGLRGERCDTVRATCSPGRSCSAAIECLLDGACGPSAAPQHPVAPRRHRLGHTRGTAPKGRMSDMAQRMARARTRPRGRKSHPHRTATITTPDR